MYILCDIIFVRNCYDFYRNLDQAERLPDVCDQDVCDPDVCDLDVCDHLFLTKTFLTWTFVTRTFVTILRTDVCDHTKNGRL